jgi:hypothetical protein
MFSAVLRPPRFAEEEENRLPTALLKVEEVGSQQIWQTSGQKKF